MPPYDPSLRGWAGLCIRWDDSPVIDLLSVVSQGRLSGWARVSSVSPLKEIREALEKCFPVVQQGSQKPCWELPVDHLARNLAQSLRVEMGSWPEMLALKPQGTEFCQ